MSTIHSAFSWIHWLYRTHTHMCTWIYRTCCSRVQVVERQLETLEFRNLSWKPVHFKASSWCAGSSVCSTLLSFLHGMFVIKQLPGGSGNTLEMLALLLFASQGLSPLGQPVGQMLSWGGAGFGNDVSHDGHVDYFAGLLCNLACTQTAPGCWFSLIHVWVLIHWTTTTHTTAITSSFVTDAT